ncbi:hypothetical protein Salat_2893700 [Sesamum alatum]|uniref:Uncharacterized protein n=1 Tax=Sesamum alatum TaxID=300844 RepID=A0AAE1XIH1_9LAMI|nr:hypothetical protein Salat_2893700 [Sesamum alatum]
MEFSLDQTSAQLTPAEELLHPLKIPKPPDMMSELINVKRINIQSYQAMVEERRLQENQATNQQTNSQDKEKEEVSIRCPSYRSKLINSSNHIYFPTWLHNWEEQSLEVCTKSEEKEGDHENSQQDKAQPLEKGWKIINSRPESSKFMERQPIQLLQPRRMHNNPGFNIKQATTNQHHNQAKIWVPKKDLPHKISQQQEDGLCKHQNKAEGLIQEDDRINEDRRQQEKFSTSAIHIDVQDLDMVDKNSRQVPDFAHGIARKEGNQAQVEDMQSSESDTCMKEITETGVNTSSPVENIELDSENQELVSDMSISKREPINILLNLNRNRIVDIKSTSSESCIPPNCVIESSKNSIELAQTPPPLLTCKLDTSVQPKDGTNTKPQKLPTNLESDSASDRTKQQHGAPNTTIHNSDTGSAITKHLTKLDQPVLSNSAKHADNTTTSPCYTYDNIRSTYEEFPPGFEPRFKFQSSNDTNTCNKPKRQRGRPKLTR